MKGKEWMLWHCPGMLPEAVKLMNDFVGANGSLGAESATISLRGLAVKGSFQMVRPPLGPGTVPGRQGGRVQIKHHQWDCQALQTTGAELTDQDPAATP